MKSRPQSIRILASQPNKLSGSVDPSGVIAAIFNRTIANVQHKTTTNSTTPARNWQSCNGEQHDVKSCTISYNASLSHSLAVREKSSYLINKNFAEWVMSDEYDTCHWLLVSAVTTRIAQTSNTLNVALNYISRRTYYK